MECRSKIRRINAAHLRSTKRCTGKIKSFEEYVRTYPNSPIMDFDIRQKTAVTLENLIRKYGDVDGTNRWNLYRERQAHSNSFEYKLEKYGWTVEQYQKFN